MDRAEVLKIADNTASEIIHRYQPPSSIEYGLAESSGEEKAAWVVYLKRSRDAIDKEDQATADLYFHLAKEEFIHNFEINNRLGVLSGRPGYVNPVHLDMNNPSDMVIKEFLDTARKFGVEGIPEDDDEAVKIIRLNYLTMLEEESHYVDDPATFKLTVGSIIRINPGDKDFGDEDGVIEDDWGDGSYFVKFKNGKGKTYNRESFKVIKVLIDADPATFKIEAADVGHKALVYGKEGYITGVGPKGEWYNLKMKDGSELRHEPKANVTVLGDVAMKAGVEHGLTDTEATDLLKESKVAPDDLTINSKKWQLECTYLTRKEALDSAEFMDHYKLFKYLDGYALYERNYWDDRSPKA